MNDESGRVSRSSFCARFDPAAAKVMSRTAVPPPLSMISTSFRHQDLFGFRYSSKAASERAPRCLRYPAQSHVARCLLLMRIRFSSSHVSAQRPSHRHGQARQRSLSLSDFSAIMSA